MNPLFKQAVDNGYLKPSMMPDGSAMVIDGKMYYEPTESGAKMAVGRYHVALDIVRMHEELRISFEQLNNFVQQVKQLSRDILSETDLNKIRETAMTIHQASNTTEARIGFGRDTEQVYQIASIWFVSEDENPSFISFTAVNEKARLFMSRPDLYGFFLGLPLSRFLSSSEVSDTGTLSFSQMHMIQELEDKISFLLSMKKQGIENELTSSFFLRTGILTDSVNSAMELSRITTKQSQPLSET
jgi:hypothetical protein